MSDRGDRWREVDALFDAALDLPAAERAAFLDAQCPPELRAQVEALLESSSRLDTFLPPGEVLGGALANSLFDEIEAGDSTFGEARPGAVIDEYRLVARLGEGGMGEVWEAEQTAPVRRRVALKLLKLGMDSKRVVARFESERQALALMSHHAVAQVFGGGTTPAGRPYFVMELVHGVSVTEYARQKSMGLDARLALFLEICDGVQHAHHKGIVHRDLKPSNILVTEEDGKPVPKIIDFGVARALDTRLNAETFVTEQGQIIGTPEYMSPEQADPGTGDIDTRADVYALGVLLYELLAGVRPFDADELKTLGFLELMRRIRETDPPRPSQRADSTQSRKLRGDLDWIVMKALEKDRSLRYVSPHEMAEDVRRHLSNQPVLAGPPSRAYRLRKMVRRNRGAMLTAALVVAALVAGAIAATTQAVRATRAERAARAEAETARQVSDFLVELFETSDPMVARGQTVTARELLDRGAARMNDKLGGQPLVRARLMAMMGRTYRNLGLYEPATAMLEEALKTREQILGRSDSETVRILTTLARLHSDQRQEAKAEGLYREALVRLASSPKPDRMEEARIRCQLAGALIARAAYAESEQLFHECREAFVRERGPRHSTVASAWGDLGSMLNVAGRRQEAEQAYRKAIEIREATDPKDPRLATTLNNLGSLLVVMERLDEGEKYLQRAVEIDARVFGPEHPKLAITLGSLASLHGRQGRLDQAAASYARVLAIREKAHGAQNVGVAEVLNDLALLSILKGDDGAARAALDRALSIEQKTVGDAHSQTITTYAHLGLLHLRRAEYDAAEAAFRKGLAAADQMRGTDAQEHVSLLRGLADVALRRSRLQEAEPLLARALAIADKDEAGRSQLAPALNGLGALRLAQRRLEDAREALDRARTLPLQTDRVRLETLTLIGHVLAAQGRAEEAEAAYREAIALAEKPVGGSHVEAAEPLSGLGGVLARRGASEEAAASLERALAVRRRVLGRTHPETLATARTLAALQARTRS